MWNQDVFTIVGKGSTGHLQQGFSATESDFYPLKGCTHSQMEHPLSDMTCDWPESLAMS